MKWLVVILSIVWLTGCAAGNQPSPVLTSAPSRLTPVSPPARSLELAATLVATLAAEDTPASSSIISRPIEIAASSVPTPPPTPRAHSQATAAPALPECPPLPAANEVKTPAAVQHFEHGLMFWLQARDEIWTLIDSPLESQFYWRLLPNGWAEGQPGDDPSIQPPAGRFQPQRGFGAAWRRGGGSYGPQRADLGWAIDEEASFGAALIYYPQGFYSPDCTWMPKSGIYELTDEHGTVYQFVGAGGVARIVAGNQ